MDAKREISEFLRTRRARLTPEEAGIQTYGLNRKVQGLRREEVALLAGVSVDYYTRIERGNIAGASPSVLDAVARALQLTDVEREHLYRLSALSVTRRPQGFGGHTLKPHHLTILNAITEMPAYIGNTRMDILHTNYLGGALYTPVAESPVAGMNLARYVFLDPSSAQFFPNWTKIAEDSAASLRVSAARFPNEPELNQLIGELGSKSDYFRALWAKQNVYRHSGGEKVMVHPAVGELTLGYEGMPLMHDDFLKIVIYSAEPGTAAAERIKLLGSWMASRVESPREL